MPTAYLLFAFSCFVFFVSRRAATRLKASGDRRLLEMMTSNIAEVSLIFAAIAGVYSLASFAIISVINRFDITLSQLNHFDEFLKQSREFGKKAELTTWWFVLLLLLLAPFSFLRAPTTDITRHPFLHWVGRVAFHLSNALHSYRKLYKRLTIALAFAVSFTFLPGMNGGDIERLTSARLQHAGKQLAKIDDFYRKTVAANLAREIVDRSIAAMLPDYGASVLHFPDGARGLDKHIQGLEEVYKISLKPLHQEVAL